MNWDFMCFTCGRKFRRPKDYKPLPEKCPKCGGSTIQEMCCNTCENARVPEDYPERLDGVIECSLDGSKVYIEDRCEKFKPMKVQK